MSINTQPIRAAAAGKRIPSSFHCDSPPSSCGITPRKEAATPTPARSIWDSFQWDMAADDDYNSVPYPPPPAWVLLLARESVVVVPAPSCSPCPPKYEAARDAPTAPPSGNVPQPIAPVALPPVAALRYSAYVGNLHRDASGEEVKAFLETTLNASGVIVRPRVNPGNGANYAFVDFISRGDLEAAIDSSSQERLVLRGRIMRINESKSTATINAKRSQQNQQ